MKKMLNLLLRTSLLAVLMVLVSASCFAANYSYKTETFADECMTAGDDLQAVQKAMQAAEKKFAGKTVVLKGRALDVTAAQTGFEVTFAALDEKRIEGVEARYLLGKQLIVGVPYDQYAAEVKPSDYMVVEIAAPEFHMEYNPNARDDGYKTEVLKATVYGKATRVLKVKPNLTPIAQYKSEEFLRYYFDAARVHPQPEEKMLKSVPDFTGDTVKLEGKVLSTSKDYLGNRVIDFGCLHNASGGYNWELYVYPRGDVMELKDDSYVTFVGKVGVPKRISWKLDDNGKRTDAYVLYLREATIDSVG